MSSYPVKSRHLMPCRHLRTTVHLFMGCNGRLDRNGPRAVYPCVVGCYVNQCQWQHWSSGGMGEIRAGASYLPLHQLTRCKQHSRCLPRTKRQDRCLTKHKDQAVCWENEKL